MSERSNTKNMEMASPIMKYNESGLAHQFVSNTWQRQDHLAIGLTACVAALRVPNCSHYWCVIRLLKTF